MPGRVAGGQAGPHPPKAGHPSAEPRSPPHWPRAFLLPTHCHPIAPQHKAMLSKGSLPELQVSAREGGGSGPGPPPRLLLTCERELTAPSATTLMEPVTAGPVTSSVKWGLRKHPPAS